MLMMLSNLTLTSGACANVWKNLAEQVHRRSISRRTFESVKTMTLTVSGGLSLVSRTSRVFET